MNWVPYSRELASNLWDKLKDSKSLWKELDASCFEDFIDRLENSDLLCDFGFGLGRVTGLVPGHCCRVHAVFWSKDMFRKQKDVMGAIGILGVKHQLKRIECIVPVDAKGLNRYMVKLGFEKEGTIRAYYKVPSGFYDGNLYSLIGGIHG